MVHRPVLLSRRQLLVGGTAAAGALLLGACGDDDAGSSATSVAPGGSAGEEGLALVPFVGGAPVHVPGPVRVPFGVADGDGLLPVDGAPDELEVQVLDGDGQPLGDAMTVARRATGLPRPYYAVRTVVEAAGVYTIRTEVDGIGSELAFQVFEGDQAAVLGPGDPLPAIATPTVDDAHGVDPICTADPVCPLHDVTLEAALAEGQPTALLVSTPAFCQMAICGPVLDVALQVRERFPHVRFLHAEVYAEPDVDLERTAPIVDALGLHFEPCLFLAGADGRIVERLDTIYDEVELADRLAALA
ncbi:MAG TPA: hypothetical protein VK007_07615 [Acidimicrobiales bacterium]|nr:hypothetical protein [Acidimicrobiales bacterium]